MVLRPLGTSHRNHGDALVYGPNPCGWLRSNTMLGNGVISGSIPIASIIQSGSKVRTVKHLAWISALSKYPHFVQVWIRRVSIISSFLLWKACMCSCKWVLQTVRKLAKCVFSGGGGVHEKADYDKVTAIKSPLHCLNGKQSTAKSIAYLMHNCFRNCNKLHIWSYWKMPHTHYYIWQRLTCKKSIHSIMIFLLLDTQG